MRVRRQPASADSARRRTCLLTGAVSGVESGDRKPVTLGLSLISASATPLAGATAAIAASFVVAVDVLPQKRNQWCWAAIGSALTELYDGSRRSQAVVASEVLGKNCVAKPGPCNIAV